MRKIQHELLKLNANLQIEILFYSDPKFFQDLLKFRPSVVLTFPFTSIGIAKFFYGVKFFFNSKIICLRTEGAYNFDSDTWASKFWIMCAAGFDKYNWKLVDKEIFWGPKLASVIGQELVNQKKVKTSEDILVFGNPRYEDLVNSKTLEVPPEFVRINSKFNEFPKEKRVLILTGFHMADYTVEDYYRAGDLNVEENLDNLIDFSTASGKLRVAYIEMILNLAKRFPDLLLVVKKHPIEKNDFYEKTFKDCPNVLFIFEPLDSQIFISNTSLLIHYGSTVLMESYLAKIPSIYAFLPDTLDYYTSLSWPSTIECPVNEVGEKIQNYLDGKVTYRETAISGMVLSDNFNIKSGQFYNPSAMIASELLKPMRPVKRWNLILDFYGLYNLLIIFKIRIKTRIKNSLIRMQILKS